MNGNGIKQKKPALSYRAQEVEKLLNLTTAQLLPFISAADRDGGKLVGELLAPQDLERALELRLPDGDGYGEDGLQDVIGKILKYSVNTWDPGFMDKLYASTDPVGVASDLLLTALNTNVHVYQVSPALTIIERETAQRFARLFGFEGAHAGGITLPGGSASNSTSMIVAKNTLFPKTKTEGNSRYRFVVFTSDHGHYSVKKAAILLGLGSDAVWRVKVDRQGRMLTDDLESKILEAKEKGFAPFYVNAGAGTTVFGSYDPLDEIADICERHGLWFHVDGSWGGSVVFSDNLKWKLKGAERSDSLTVNPHKMLGVPVTCSFLLTGDRRRFYQALELKAGYLFHEKDDAGDVYDLAQMTMGCGRRGDALKMALGWIYYGKAGYQSRINRCFEMAEYFATTLEKRKGFHIISENPPPCLQVCFFYIGNSDRLLEDPVRNTAMTRQVASGLLEKGYMVDYSPDITHGEFFRAVVNSQTTKETINSLVMAIEELGAAIDLDSKNGFK